MASVNNENSRMFLITLMTRAIRTASGLHERYSYDIACRVVDEISAAHGCEKLYIPGQSKTAKRAAVLRDFNGQNADEVCQAHGIGKSTLYRYLQESS